MAIYRVTQVNWNNQTIFYVRTSHDLRREDKVDALIDLYQKDGAVVFIAVEHEGMYYHKHNGDLMVSFLKAVDTSRLPYGNLMTI